MIKCDSNNQLIAFVISDQIRYGIKIKDKTNSCDIWYSVVIIIRLIIIPTKVNQPYQYCGLHYPNIQFIISQIASSYHYSDANLFLWIVHSLIDIMVSPVLFVFVVTQLASDCRLTPPLNNCLLKTYHYTYSVLSVSSIQTIIMPDPNYTRKPVLYCWF